jgi:two-component system, OmpR family, KDP operon response regulator KdpE
MTTNLSERTSLSNSRSQADAQVLVVEDDDAMLRSIVEALAARGYRVLPARNAAAAIDSCSENNPDLVLLDLGLPDFDGIDCCRYVRQWTKNPIIVITADHAEARKVLALDTGADDYVTKPFSMPELQARVRAALRHRSILANMVDAVTLDIGSLRIDVRGRSVWADGEPVELARREFDLLLFLARNLGKTLPSQYILSQVWGPEWAGNLKTLRRHVATLRAKIEGYTGMPRIVTEARRGYRLVDDS